MDLISSQTSKVIAKAMDGVTKRHTAILSNIANAETPGYRSLQVSFEDNLKQAIESEKHKGQVSKFLPPGSMMTSRSHHYNPHPIAQSIDLAESSVDQSELVYRQDQNGVDVEQQMAQLAKNTQHYMALSRLEGREFNLMRNIIKGGGNV